MPLPKPKKGETKRDFVQRCMSEFPDKDTPQDQKFAICNVQYDRRGKKKEKK